MLASLLSQSIVRGTARSQSFGLFSPPSSISLARHVSTLGLRQPLSQNISCLARSRTSTLVQSLTHSRNFTLASLFTRSKPSPSLTPSVVNHIARLEADANVYTQDIAKQVAFLQALLDTQFKSSYDLIIARWEKIAQFDPENPLIKSSKAFEIYLTALVNTDQRASVYPAVRRRQAILGEAATAESAAPTEKAAESATSNNTVLETPSTQPVAPSQQIANAVLGGKVAPLTPAPSPPFVPTTGTSIYGANVEVAQGTAGNPVQVTVVERAGAWVPKFLRWLVSLAFAGFFLLVILSVFLENTGIMKKGSTQNQFEAPDGKKKVTFADVHGIDEAKEEVQDIIAFLKDPASFNKLGGRMPKGVLLTGPPGTGKTLLARAVAGEADVPFFFASGSDFEEMFVGVGAKRVRELFAAARKKEPSIIFIDELDAVGGKRSTRDAQHARQTLNQLLTEMDGFQQSEGVIVIAATNFPQTLDKALVRPGRFDRTIQVQLPDIRGRAQIIQHHMKDVVVAEDVNPKTLARSTPGFSGAELQNMINLAAIQASKEKATQVGMQHMEWAKDRINMGAESKRKIDESTKLNTAYHEGGHALVALYTPGARPLHKVTCMPRGDTLGHTAFLTDERREAESTFKELRAHIDVSMGGRVAEALLRGEDGVTTGASSDIQNASMVARRMVMNYGFSRLGPLDYSDRDNLSPARRDEIEDEVTKLVRDGETRVAELLKTRMGELHLLANALVEHETLDIEQVKKVVKGEKLKGVDAVLDEELQLTPPPQES